MKTSIITLIIIALPLTVLQQPLSAQTHFQTGMQFYLGIPQGQFADNLDNPGAGFGGEFLYSPASSPFGVGLSLGYLIYGNETRSEKLDPLIDVDVTTSNNLLTGHLLLRAQNKARVFSPYADLLFGFNYLYTRTSMKSGWDDEGDNEIASDTNFEDTVLSYGAGGGVMVKLWQGDVNSEEGGKKPLKLMLDLRVHYLRGGEAEYLKKGSISIDEHDQVSYDVQRSTTDLLMTQLGVTVEF